ncbi:hypothetical protein L6164_003618 [Bauhinia variegata]|uniref:Uncharacterized protein n=1 Tax=Bauhinia variegata TaxID=167791 RepID=A0ACB9Q106_BAUVA|nr:hypothetical protein L6164_003618 [Bauhinia variegata]
MSQCVVPSWEVDDNNPTAPRVSLRSHSNSTAPDVPMLDYEVAELTWENGQISMHGLGFPRVPAKTFTAAAAANTGSTVSTSPAKYTWEKPRAGGTLEAIVNQATGLPNRSKILFGGVGVCGGDGDDLVPWFDSHRAAAVAPAAAASNTMTMDALVPCSNRKDEQSTHSLPGIGMRMVGSSTRLESCSGCAATHDEDAALLAEKRARVARVPIAHEWSSWDQNHSMSGSATIGRDSQQMSLDTSDKEIGAGFTSTSNGSPEKSTSAKQCTKTTASDDHDSVCHSRSQRDGDDEEDKKKGTGKSSVSTKRSRAAAIHNQSERKRRDKINQRMKTLQKLVPNSSKTDKASMLDEVIEYLKQLQAQVQMMSRMNMSPMMMPMTMPQQLQMSMMAPMGMGLGLGMGMGMGIGMDMNTMGRPNIPGMPPVLHPSAFMSMGSWDASGAAAADRMQGTPAAVLPDLLSTFLACQSQPTTMEAYSRLAAMYQQLHQPPASSSKG